MNKRILTLSLLGLVTLNALAGAGSDGQFSHVPLQSAFSAFRHLDVAKQPQATVAPVVKPQVVRPTAKVVAPKPTLRASEVMASQVVTPAQPSRLSRAGTWVSTKGSQVGGWVSDKSSAALAVVKSNPKTSIAIGATILTALTGYGIYRYVKGAPARKLAREKAEADKKQAKDFPSVALPAAVTTAAPAVVTPAPKLTTEFPSVIAANQAKAEAAKAKKTQVTKWVIRGTAGALVLGAAAVVAARKYGFTMPAMFRAQSAGLVK